MEKKLQKLPDLSGYSRELATNNARVTEFVDSLASFVDDVIDAVTARNWQELERLCNYIGRGGEIIGHPHLSERARQLAGIAKQGDEAEIRRGVVRLIGATGRGRENTVDAKSGETGEAK
jgi:hypothetical protein